jgi:hypothetical protein
MKVTQEQVDQYVADTLQPLVNELIEFAKGKKIPPTDFYLACLSITKHALENSTGSQVERIRKELFELASEWVTDTLRLRMEETK